MLNTHYIICFICISSLFQAISVTFCTFSGKQIFPVHTGKCSPPLTVMLPKAKILPPANKPQTSLRSHLISSSCYSKWLLTTAKGLPIFLVSPPKLYIQPIITSSSATKYSQYPSESKNSPSLSETCNLRSYTEPRNKNNVQNNY